MSSNSLDTLIETLAAGIMALQPDDLPALAAHIGLFRDLAALSSERPRLAAGALACAALLEKIVFEEIKQPQPAIDAVAQALALIQSASAAGHDVQPDFPALLQVASSQNLAAPSPGGHPGFTLSHPTGMPANVDPQIFGDFLARQAGVLEEMESHIIRLEKDNSPDALASFRRMVHTLKGEAGLLGLDAINHLCHAVEDTLARREPRSMGDALLRFRDWLDRAFASYAGKGQLPGPIDELIALLQAPADVPAAAVAPPAPSAPAGITAENAQPAAVPAPEGPAKSGASLQENSEFTCDFISETNENMAAVESLLLKAEINPGDIENLNAIFRAFHTTKGVAGFLELEDLQKLAHEVETILDRARKGQLVLTGDAIETMFDAVGATKGLVQRVQDALTKRQPLEPDPSLPALLVRLRTVTDLRLASPVTENPSPVRKLGEILIDKQITTPEAVAAALKKQQEPGPSPRPLGVILTQDEGVPAREVARALQEQKAAVAANAPAIKETVRVDTIRLDRLVDTIGELVIAEAMVAQAALTGTRNAATNRHVAHLNKITRELHQIATSLRLVPLRSTFERMARVARDVSKKLSKPVNFVLQGEDTELDKTVVDQLGDPLIHMVRNSIDHGLEHTPEDREKTGKPPAGRVELRAFHKGGNVHIEISDDGRGFDRAAILKKARDNGLVRADEQLTDAEIDRLIFAPGLSTAKQVTDVSGRGVGMDVVKRQVEKLHGKVDIQSITGKGSTFTIILPLTMAMLEGMVVRIADHRYIIPTLAISHMLQPTEKMISTVVGRGTMLNLENELVPLLRLDKLFNLGKGMEDPTKAMAVVVEHEGQRVGILTDQLLGQQQIVVKGLGDALKNIPGLAGGTIMSDGRVGLIIDIEGLLNLNPPLPRLAAA